MKKLSNIVNPDRIKSCLNYKDLLKGRIYENGTLLYEGEFAVWENEDWYNYILAPDLDSIIIEYNKEISLTFVYTDEKPELMLKTETQLSIEKHIDNIKTNINKLIDKHNT